MLDRYHTIFVRAGAALDEDGQETARRDRRAAGGELGTQFSQNVLAAENGFHLVLGEDDLDGLPAVAVFGQRREAARERGP